VVGNALSFHTGDFTKFIDDFDIVCRINRPAPFYSAMGHKTTFLYYGSAKKIPQHDWAPGAGNYININYDIEEFTQKFDKDYQGKHNTQLRLSTGFIAIYHQLVMNPTITIIGFDWFASSNWYEHQPRICHNYRYEKWHIENDPRITVIQPPPVDVRPTYALPTLVPYQRLNT